MEFNSFSLIPRWPSEISSSYLLALTSLPGNVNFINFHPPGPAWCLLSSFSSGKTLCADYAGRMKPKSAILIASSHTASTTPQREFAVRIMPTDQVRPRKTSKCRVDHTRAETQMLMTPERHSNTVISIMP